MNIEYHNTIEVPLDKKGKPTKSWMTNWTQEERTAKFFEFCKVFDKREDSLLKEDYQIFSHRLHWHEHPYCDFLPTIKNNRDKLWYTILYSFSNEHWLTLMTLHEKGIDGLKARFKDERHARSDLFQIYYPKNTNVKEWLLTGPKKAADALHHILEKRDRPYTMMEFAKILAEHFATEQGFRNPMYPCKNAARYMAMSHPHLVDPESVLHGGTGFFDGMQQVFDCPNYMGKASYDIGPNGEYVPTSKGSQEMINLLDMLAAHPDNPMYAQKYLNLEDKLCFFYKHIAINHGVKKPTKRIPYEWIFPQEFSLKKTND